MRKFISVLALFSILAVLVAPTLALAQNTPQDCCKLKRAINNVGGVSCSANTVVGPASAASCDLGTPTCVTENWGLFCTLNTLNTIVDWIFTIMVVLAVLFAILGAFNILTASGQPEKVTTGRNYILYAAIGLVVGLIARAVPSIAKSVMGF